MATKIKVQRPPPGTFTRDKLAWDKNNTAFIQAGRFLDFVLGETIRIFPRTVFLVDEKGISEDILFSEKKIYQCAHGPEDTLHSAKQSRPDSIMKLGCQCRFSYRKLRGNPDVVCIVFEERQHVTCDGRYSHGVLDDGFMDGFSGNPSRYTRRLSPDIRSWIFSRLQAKLSAAEILAEHRENVLSRMQKEGMKYQTCPDDFMRLSNIQNVVSSVRKGTWRDVAEEVRFGREMSRLIRQEMLEKTGKDPAEHIYGPLHAERPARTFREVVQDVNWITLWDKLQSVTAKEPLDLTSSSESEGGVTPVDRTPEVSSRPADMDAYLREMAKGSQSSQNYYASMFTHVTEALKTAQTGPNKRKPQECLTLNPPSKRPTWF